MTNGVRDFRGNVMLKKVGGGGALASNAQRNILCQQSLPDNPLNREYPDVINAADYTTVRVDGKPLPSASMNAFMKPYVPGTPDAGWCDGDIFKSLIQIGSNGNTDDFAIGYKSDLSGVEVWDMARCTSISMSGNGMSGPVAVTLNFLARYGNDCPYGDTLATGEVLPAARTFVIPSAPDGGDLTASGIDVGFVGLTEVREWNFFARRGQIPKGDCDETDHIGGFDSTMFGCGLVVRQPSTATGMITDAGAVTIKFNTKLTAGTGRFKLDLILSLDNNPHARTTGMGFTRSMLTGYNGAGNPMTITEY